METRARYVLIGLFTLGVIAAVFGFVYWLHNTGGLGSRASYRVRFDGSVSGLLTGSGVLFNGVRVGEVTSLTLDPANPKEVMATIAVDAATPVRTDTAVGMDFQGLTGAPVIILSGGTPTAPALTSTDGDLPLLVAPPNAGETLSQSARAALGHLDKMVTDNADDLKKAIGSFSTFSQALGRNSDRVDGILAGLDRMTGGANAKAKQPNLTLSAPQDLKLCVTAFDAQIVVSEPASLMSLNSDKIPFAGPGPAPEAFAAGQFSDNLPALMQSKVIESLENTHCFRAVTRVIDNVEADGQVVLDIRNFSVTTTPSAVADFEVSAKFVSKGKIFGTKIFHEKKDLASVDAPGAGAALDAAFGKVVTALVPWVAHLWTEAAAAPKKTEFP